MRLIPLRRRIRSDFVIGAKSPFEIPIQVQRHKNCIVSIPLAEKTEKEPPIEKYKSALQNIDRCGIKDLDTPNNRKVMAKSPMVNEKSRSFFRDDAAMARQKVVHRGRTQKQQGSSFFAYGLSSVSVPREKPRRETGSGWIRSSQNASGPSGTRV